VALQLRKNGVLRVRPLLGGIEAWIELSLPTEALGGELPTPEAPAPAAD
jgi:hypothetical protein